MPVINEHSMVKIYTGAILSMFSDIQLKRRDTTPYTVPVYYGSKSRLYKHLNKMAENQTGVIYQQLLPAMSLSTNGLVQNKARQTNRLLKKKIVEIDTQNVTLNWNDTTVDIPFQLSLISKNLTEMTNLAEYIVSVFKNGLYYIDVNTPLSPFPISTPIILEDSSFEIDNQEDEYSGDLYLETTFNFTVRGILHNNVTSDSKIITNIAINAFMDLEYSKIVESYNIVAI